MWLLSFLPEWSVHALALLAVIGVVLSLLPIPYRQVVQILSVAALAFALFLEGSLSEKKVWELREAEINLEVEKLKSASSEVTVKVVTKYVDRYKTVTEKADEVIREVPIYITQKADAACTITDGFVLLHDSAARGELPQTPGTLNDEASGVKLSEVGETLAQNYKKYHQLATQLESLQEWIREQEKLRVK